MESFHKCRASEADAHKVQLSLCSVNVLIVFFTIRKIQEESLRTYIFSYGYVYDTLR